MEEMTITDGRWRVPVPEQPADIERAAITMLKGAMTFQPILGYWVEALVNNPAYATPFEKAVTHRDFEGSPSWEQLVEERGGAEEVIAYLRARGEAVEDVERAISRRTAYPGVTVREQRLRAWRDEITLHLARALYLYRLDGRPVGDTTTTLRGIGGPLATITTSLATAMAEYAASLDDMWAAIDMGQLDS